MSRLNQSILVLTLAGLLAACEREVILSGQRFGVDLPLEDSAEAQPGGHVTLAPALENRVVALNPGAPVVNADWTHRAGSPSHAMPHLALSAAPQRIWSAPIGAGDGRRERIATAPVVAGGQVFAMDAANRVTAVSTASGGVVWSLDVTAPGERSASASGGGLAHGGGRLFVTTGFGELIAVDPASGGVIWRHRFDAPVTGAPTVAGGTVYVSSRDSAGWAMSAEDGREQWVISAVPSSSGFAGPAAPAVTDRLAIFPFGSGEVIAATRVGGNRAWVTPVAGQRRGRALAFVNDITGDPVVSDGVVYAGSASGQTVAVRADSGTRIWSAREGALGPVWPAGGSVFLVSDNGRLVRLDAASGEAIWAVALGEFTRDTVRRQRDVVAHYGPVLAGGRLIVASSDGGLRFFAPDSGAEVGRVEIPGGAAAAPAIAGGTLYVVGRNGQLHAFR